MMDRRRIVPVTFLVAANVWPLVGVLALGWDVATLMVLYWFDNVATGLWTVVKLLHLQAGGMAAFFVFHYGMFMFGHGLFVTLLFLGDRPFGGLTGILPVIAVPAAIILVSHGTSFVVNFLGREADTLAVKEVMMAPYKRMALLHVTIIFGGFIVNVTGAHWIALAFLVVLKTVFDLRTHLQEHAPGATPWSPLQRVTA